MNYFPPPFNPNFIINNINNNILPQPNSKVTNEQNKPEFSMKHENHQQNLNPNITDLLNDNISMPNPELFKNFEGDNLRKKEFMNLFYNQFEDIRKQIISMKKNANYQTTFINYIYKNLEAVVEHLYQPCFPGQNPLLRDIPNLDFPEELGNELMNNDNKDILNIMQNPNVMNSNLANNIKNLSGNKMFPPIKVNYPPNQSVPFPNMPMANFPLHLMNYPGKELNKISFQNFEQIFNQKMNNPNNNFNLNPTNLNLSQGLGLGSDFAFPPNLNDNNLLNPNFNQNPNIDLNDISNNKFQNEMMNINNNDLINNHCNSNKDMNNKPMF